MSSPQSGFGGPSPEPPLPSDNGASAHRLLGAGLPEHEAVRRAPERQGIDAGLAGAARRVLQHDGFRCSCGAPAVEVDHVLARELGRDEPGQPALALLGLPRRAPCLRHDAERSRLRPLDLRGRCRAPVFPPRCDLPNQSRARLVRVAHYEPRVHDTLRFRPRVVTTSTGEHCSAALGTPTPWGSRPRRAMRPSGRGATVRKFFGKYGSKDLRKGCIVKVRPVDANEALT